MNEWKSMALSDGETASFVQSGRYLESDEDEDEDFNDSKVLRDSIIIYGGLLVGIIIVFSWLRRRFPNAYNVRSWSPDYKTYLAEDQYRFFSWMWRLYMITDDEIMDECGLDAACFVRLIQMGYRLSLVGMFNTIWLLPIYFTSEDSSENDDITDKVVKTTIAHLPSGSNRLYATVFASYILFGYTMYQILREFEWYIKMRHKFLRKPLVRHFAVFVRNIPSDFRTNPRLESFFRSCFSENDVLEARLALNAPNLAKVVAQRDTTLANLEHAWAQYQKDGVRPQHNDKLMVLGETVDSIDYYTAELDKLNKDIEERKTKLEPLLLGSGQEDAPEHDDVPIDENDEKHTDEEDIALELPSGFTTSPSNGTDSPKIDMNVSGLTSGASIGNDENGKENVIFGLGRKMQKKVTTAAGAAATTATGVANRAVSMVLGTEDGEIFPGGFVVFSKLSTTNAALQMIHHEKPFAMEIMEAPDPREIFWLNVSRTHKDLQVGMLLSLTMTIALCLVWTIPISFFASLSNASAVREDVDWLDDLLNKYPGLVRFTEQIAPLLVVLLNALLPKILEFISLFEGPISSGVVEASTFVKLAFFMIIQTFFVSAVSGGVMQAVFDIIEDWTEIIDLLANTLPSQGTYFMQILLVSTAWSAAFEMCRLFPILKAVVRGRVGPNLTEKERNKDYMGLKPLSAPRTFEHADSTSQLVLYFMVLFVYCVISPITPIITWICFAFMGAMYRGQFIYIYGKDPDSGGKLWASFIQIMLSCMLIAEITIFGLLGLKKAVKQIPLFIPLLIITVLFNLYIRQMHFRVATYLPTRECLKEDLQRDVNFDFSFVRGAYLQPALSAKTDVQPDPSVVEKSESISINDASLKV